MLSQQLALIAHDSTKKKSKLAQDSEENLTAIYKTCPHAHALPLVRVNIKMTTDDTK